MPAHTATTQAAFDAADVRRDTALWLAARGYPVHPLAPGTKCPAPNCAKCRRGSHDPAACPCIGSGHWCHGFYAATTDPDVIAGWWNRQPEFGIGVATGCAGLIVLDIDNHPVPLPDRQRLLPGIPVDDHVDLTGLSTGFDTIALLAAYRSQPNPAEDQTTLRVRTPSGGLHIWYRAPLTGPTYCSSTGSSTRTALAWQVDIRAAAGYIVAPTTRTALGTYEALPGPRTPARLPLWLQAELTRTGHARPPQSVASPGPMSSPAARHRDADRILSSLLQAVRDCAHEPSGTAFSEKLNRAAFTAGGLVAGGHLTESACFAVLVETANGARPAQPRRNQLIIDSAFRAGSNRPIHPKGRS
ncbi:bifunctional DNA primase/polymerase [Streptomyces sp. NRRL F-2664]|uniref:bifunctional DNA primase/polymerase n=1 Tax=Streptomyces sp. NRRL F-2664 TaxID=1463842 RepID=UPI000997365B|nr:bifunctional DNA primase/polymerase [Streptomyces sp. NRRL F-2664]